MTDSNTTINAEAIPAVVKERDQWLLWDASHDTPRRPHWDGDFYNISWNDPDDWRSFEEALELAEAVESYGIGYVVQPEDPIYVIDLDEPFDDEGHPREWFPGLDFFEAAGCYIERSPSGNGIHIPVKGEPPEWWSDCEADPEGHEGVECLANKFCSFTGDTIQDGPVLELGPAPWLKEAYENIKGESPDIGESDDSSFDSDYTYSREEIEEMLSHCNNKMHYDDWYRVGYAVYAWDDGKEGKEVFRNWSKKSSKFDEYGEKVIEWIWGNNIEQDPDVDDELKITVGTLVHHAKQGGFEPPKSKAAEEALEELETLLNRYEDADEDGLSQSKRYEIGDLLADVSPDDLEELSDRVAAVLDTDTWLVERHRKLARHRRNFGPVMVDDGRTWYLSGTPLKKYELLNFEVDVHSFLKVPGEPLRAKLELRTADGEEFTKTIEPKIFSQRRRFDDEVLAERFGMTFDPGPRDDDEVLDDINKFINRQDAPTLRGTHHMGLHGDEWVVPDGSLATHGWVENPETVYLERNLAVERRVRLSPEREKYSSEDVAAILRTLPYTRDTERFLSVLGWFYAAPFRPHIYEWEGEFNLLNVTGGTGSGKTTTLRYLWRCFGMAGEPFDCWDTNFVLLSTLASTNSFPIWFDEYKPSDAQQYRVDMFHDDIRKAATGSVKQRGKADQSTVEYELQAPVVISGEQQIQPPAERRRSIMTTFRKDTTNADAPTAKAYKELAGEAFVEDGELQIPDEYPDPLDHALAYYRFVVSQDADELRELWYESRREVMEYRNSWSADLDLDDLEVQGLQTVVFGWRLFRQFAEAHGVEQADLPGESKLEAALRYVAGAVGPEGVRKSHEDRYLELVSRAAAADGYLSRGQEYEIIREGHADEEIRLHVTKSYDVISKYVRDHDLEGEDLLGSADAYRQRFEEEYEREGGYVVSYSQKTPDVGRCIGLRTEAVADAIEFDPDDLTREVPFGDGSDAGESVEADDDDDDGTGGGYKIPEPIAIGEINPSKQDRASVIGTVEFGQWDGRRHSSEEKAPAWKATLKDTTGEAKILAWDEDQIPDIYNDQGLFEADALLVKGANVGYYEEKDELQLIIGEDTIVTEAQPGAGHTEMDEAAGSESLEAAADGGQKWEQLEPRILDAMPSTPTDANEVANLIDEDVERVRNKLDRMAKRGRKVARDPNGTYTRKVVRPSETDDSV